MATENNLAAQTLAGPVAQSISIHLVLLAVGIGVVWIWPQAAKRTPPIRFEVVEVERPKPLEQTPPPISVAPRRERAKPVETKAPPPVFGLSKDTLTSAQPTGVAIKEGNTIAKEVDKVAAPDAEALPIPTDEFLVTAMPRLKSEVRAEYPAEARRRGVEGPVVLDVLIDESGRVREVQIVEGPGFGLNEAAQAALMRFVFEPARVEQRAVPVRIRYTYRFVLR